MELTTYSPSSESASILSIILLVFSSITCGGSFESFSLKNPVKMSIVSFAFLTMLFASNRSFSFSFLRMRSSSRMTLIE
ncbi:hypothetical protein MT325_m119R [Paramecium bursaria chlorella virus MT325]|uniref:Uncharacterized protein m119R n=1 Tax=Paramecium bursaria Chlorella virus MT325 TaxID=346932 RepID=A7ITJ9_PBCVM|nr:hypothetical protein MT325_m119R [Paramecium bursaria chlorella virus MT325]